MRRLGKTQVSILKTLQESSQPTIRFSSAKDVLSVLQRRGLIQINGNLVSITKEGIHALNAKNIFFKEESSSEAQKAYFLDFIDDKIEEFILKYSGLLDPLIERYQREKESWTTQELSDLSRKISNLIDAEAQRVQLLESIDSKIEELTLK
jgi:hypothetical protein